jgi:Bromodomain
VGFIGSSSSRATPGKKIKSSKFVELPNVPSWPEINLSDITKVTNDVLRRVTQRDDQNAFSLPVLEAYPELLDDYTSLIKEPMDLRTIVEERMHTYTSIQQLQDDLILIYRNCCTFNGEGSFLAKYAMERWRELNGIFADSCKSLNVLLPRRWKP